MSNRMISFAWRTNVRDSEDWGMCRTVVPYRDVDIMANQPDFVSRVNYVQGILGARIIFLTTVNTSKRRGELVQMPSIASVLWHQ